MTPHDVPVTPWTKVGSDLFHLQGNQYLLVTDYTTKYAVIRKLPPTAPSGTVVAAHKRIFSELGVPQEIVSDRGPHYKAQEFAEFCKAWGLKHTCSSPTYAQSNGAAERSIKTVKSILKKTEESGEDPDLALLAWRCTPLDGYTCSPAEMMFGRKLVVNLPTKLCPIPEHILENRRKKQEEIVDRYNQGSRPLPPLDVGAHVTFQDKDLWRPGVIIACKEDRSYEIRISNGTLVVRNRRHIRLLNIRKTIPKMIPEAANPKPLAGKENMTLRPSQDLQQPVKEKTVRFTEPEVQDQGQSAYKTRSGRSVKPPPRYRNDD